MDNAKNTIEKEFSAVGFINREEDDMDIPWNTYYVNIRLNGFVKLIRLGQVDGAFPTLNDYTSVEPFFDKHKLLEIHNLYEEQKNQHKKEPLIILANITGKYIFNLNNPDKDHIEIENASLTNPISNISLNVSLNRSYTYTGIVTSVERQENFLVITLDTTDIKFKCPFDSIKSIDLFKPISISVNEHINTQSNPRYSYTVTEVKLL